MFGDGWSVLGWGEVGWSVMGVCVAWGLGGLNVWSGVERAGLG
jgi:hypothetical protein